MILSVTSCLNPDMSDEFTDLVLDAAEADGTAYGMPEDADLYLMLYDDSTDELSSVLAVYEMGETYRERKVFELAAFTSPMKRRRGYLRLLLSELKSYLSDISEEELPYIFRAAVYGNELAKAVLSALSARHDHDELILSLSLKDAPDIDTGMQEEEVEIFTENVSRDGETFEEGIVSSRFASLRFRIYEKSAYIYEVLTLEGHERKGHMKRLFQKTLSFLKERTDELRLEVSSENTAASGLYERLGFRETERLSYYYFL